MATPEGPDGKNPDVIRRGSGNVDKTVLGLGPVADLQTDVSEKIVAVDSLSVSDAQYLNQWKQRCEEIQSLPEFWVYAFPHSLAKLQRLAKRQEVAIYPQEMGESVELKETRIITSDNVVVSVYAFDDRLYFCSDELNILNTQSVDETIVGMPFALDATSTSNVLDLPPGSVEVVVTDPEMEAFIQDVRSYIATIAEESHGGANVFSEEGVSYKPKGLTMEKLIHWALLVDEITIQPSQDVDFFNKAAHFVLPNGALKVMDSHGKEHTLSYTGEGKSIIIYNNDLFDLLELKKNQ